MGLVLTTPPSGEPVSLQQVKDQVRSTSTDEDGYLLNLICVARELAEKQTNRQILTATYTLTLHEFPEDSAPIELSRPPLQSVTQIDYVDTDGASQTLATTVYGVDTTAEPGCVYLKEGQVWPATQVRNRAAVTVTYVAGWNDTKKIPATLLQGILVTCAHLYENREFYAVEKTIRVEEIPGLRSLLSLNSVPEVA